MGNSLENAEEAVVKSSVKYHSQKDLPDRRKLPFHLPGEWARYHGMGTATGIASGQAVSHLHYISKHTLGSECVIPCNEYFNFQNSNIRWPEFLES